MDQPNVGLSGIQSVPEKILEKIFEFLTFKERLAASLTCKQWYQLAFSEKFCKNMRIQFTDHQPPLDDIRAYQNYRNASISIDIINPLGDFFRTAPLESLEIVSITESARTLLDDHLTLMRELTKLDLIVLKRGKPAEDVLRINHPSLKSAKINDFSGLINFEINCPNLTDLSITSITESESQKAVQLVVQLQKQLQSLEVYVHGNQQVEMLANAKLSLKRNDKLKTLRLHILDIANGIGLLLDQLDNLEELQLQEHFRRDIRHVPVGEEFSALKNLSKLSLKLIAVYPVGFENALSQMEKLRELDLDRCEFVPPPTRSWQIASAFVKNLSVHWKNGCQVMLPYCKKLKSLKLRVTGKQMDEIFVQACNSYPQLEKLHFDTTLWAEFRSATSFSHIKQLKLLKLLHLSGLQLKNVDWTDCSRIKIAKLQLTSCEIQPNEIHQLIETIGSGLQKLFLNRCNLRHSSFVITEEFVESLRQDLPRCEISCEYCERPDANRDDTVEQPENVGIDLIADWVD